MGFHMGTVLLNHWSDLYHVFSNVWFEKQILHNEYLTVMYILAAFEHI